MARNKTKTKIEIIILELILIGAAMAVFFIRGVEKYDFEEEGTYFQINYQGYIPEGSKAKIDDETGNVYVNISENETFTANGIPVYFKKSKSFVTMDDYIYVTVNNEKETCYKISYFTDFTSTEGGVTVSREDRVAAFERGFLFNGKDVYIPMDSVTVEYNGQSMNLSALSFISVSKDNWIEIYDINKDVYIFEYLDGENPVRMKDKYSEYTVYLASDLMNFPDKKIMLFSNPDMYELYDFGVEE